MKILLNPAFESLRTFVESVPHIVGEEGKTIYKGRNKIKVIKIGEIDVNVKRYRVPMFFNRVIYTFIRKSKGLRAFQYPQRLLEKGFETPQPIAYIEERNFGLIGYSSFVSVHCPYSRRFYEFGDADIKDCSDIVIAFARFSAKLHEAGILHLDYSPGNILFDKEGGEYKFSLVDINRMKFGKVSIEAGCANFARLWGQIPFFELLAKEYAATRGADEALCRDLILTYRRKFWTRFAKKHQVKYTLNF